MHPARRPSTTQAWTWGTGPDKAGKRLGRTATARATRRSSKVSPGTRSRNKLERCEHGLLRATCAICLQMEETTTDLTTGRLAPDERPARRAGDAEESPEEGE